MKVSVFRNALNIEVYREAIKTFSTHIPTVALVGKSSSDAKVDKWRSADVRYIKPNHIIHSELSKFASQFGNYDCEIVQVITYKEGNYYKWHQDGSGSGYRKLSFISILNPPNEYDGGELEIEGIDLPEYAYDPLSIIVFNPALRHRVKPITRGIRHSLVTWFKDKDFPKEML